jgi:hypothetical protein
LVNRNTWQCFHYLQQTENWNAEYLKPKHFTDFALWQFISLLYVKIKYADTLSNNIYLINIWVTNIHLNLNILYMYCAKSADYVSPHAIFSPMFITDRLRNTRYLKFQNSFRLKLNAYIMSEKSFMLFNYGQSNFENTACSTEWPMQIFTYIQFFPVKFTGSSTENRKRKELNTPTQQQCNKLTIFHLMSRFCCFFLFLFFF